MRRRNLLQLLAGAVALPGLVKASAAAPKASPAVPEHKEWDRDRLPSAEYSNAWVEGEEIVFELPERNRYGNRVLKAQLSWFPVVPGTMRLYVHGKNTSSDVVVADDTLGADTFPRSFKVNYETGELTYYPFGGIRFVGGDPDRLILQADYKYAMS